MSRRRDATRAGLGAALLSAALAAAPAAAGDKPYSNVSRGPDGRDGKITHCLFCADVDPTPGGRGGPVTDRYNGVIRIDTPGTAAVTVGSQGGNGGDGDVPALFGSPQNARDGGDAGAVSYVQGGSVFGDADQKVQSGARPQALVRVFSEGGKGGFSRAIRGGGGSAGTVFASLERDAVIEAAGRYLAGMVVQSIGGSGGVGGGLGRPGAAAGDVSAMIGADAAIRTDGLGATALVAESIGGYGGRYESKTWTPPPMVESIGGKAGSVFVTHLGAIETRGDAATGILAQSVGGRGSDQGGSISDANRGGKGGGAGLVRARIEGEIATAGAYSFGLVAQSVGGAGGTGGEAHFGGGAPGGDAAPGGRVEIFTNGARIATTGLGSTAIIGQSVGGGSPDDAFQAGPPKASSGGGNAGAQSFFHIPFFSTVAEGGAGGDGGAVEIRSSGSVVTTVGAAAHGILAQSVGGAGGTGSAGKQLGFLFSLATGGTGGGGGHGGTVTVRGDGGPAGRIVTEGQGSHGILAQSVGGGGGSGGVARAVTVSPLLAVGVAVGGSGGKGGNGGTVDVDNTFEIATAGDDGVGVMAQSVGGGGGLGGNATALAVAVPLPIPGKWLGSAGISVSVGGTGGDGGTGGAVTLVNRGTVTTAGTNAIGLQGMSVGGGGGDGGSALAYAISVAPPGASANTLSVAVGGKGKGGGAGGDVLVDNRAAVSTAGDYASGIRALSVGGGGGNAGNATARGDVLSTYQGRGLAVAIGGDGDKTQAGGNAGKAEVRNTGAITTRGAFAAGIDAQSIGGGGGNGGAGDAAAAAGVSWDKTLSDWVSQLPLATITSGNVAVGGKGGRGGAGGLAKVDNGGSIVTWGADAPGIFAQSVGGGGGDGGGYAVGSDAQAKLTIGGSGGGGGAGGSVTINNRRDALIATRRDGSFGMLVQSVGGGGGVGGTQTKDSWTPDTTGEVLAKVKEALGADVYEKLSQDPEHKSAIEVLEKITKYLDEGGAFDEIKERLKNSKWIQSYKGLIAGYSKWAKQQSDQAKDAPTRSISLSIGGAGGDGGSGGTVTVDNDGRTTTEGDVATAIIAQSIGGGGGLGGAATADGAGDNKLNISLGAGRKAGDGNTGGTVTVTNRGTVATTGASAFGILAQSIGGGGGVGTGALGDEAKNKKDTITVRAEIGGNGGRGAHGGKVTVTNTGTVTTTGQQAHAIVAHSIGGGGGIAVMNPADGDGNVKTAEERRAEAVLARFFSIVGIKPVEPDDGKEKKPPGKSYEFRLGGSSGAAGNGGDVTIDSSGTVVTQGEAAFGLLGQSIGGGGGFTSDGGPTGGYKLSMSFAGTGGGGGDGGAVTMRLSGSVRTSGDGSTAVFAQSVGGGGGYGGAREIDVPTPIFFPDAASGSSGNGGHVIITGDGVDIATEGAAAHGIHAQSLGGGGGMVTFLGGSAPVKPEDGKSRTTVGAGGAIDITLKDSTVTATGRDAYGIFAESGVQKTNGALDAGRDGGKITVKVERGSVVGGTGRGAGIRIDGRPAADTGTPSKRPANEIIIGRDASVSAGSGTAIIASFGDDRVENAGTVTGDVRLAAGGGETNLFTNTANGLYRSGFDDRGMGTVDLGPGGRFVNQGVFDVGGSGRFATATVKGRFENSGTLLVDVGVDERGRAQSDLLTGETIELDAGTSIAPHAVERLLPGRFAVVAATELRADTDIRVGRAGGPITWTAAVTRTDGKATGLTLTPSADFLGAAGDVTDGEAATLRSLQEGWDRGVPNMAKLFADIANITGRQEYRRTVDSLSPEGLATTAAAQTMRAPRSLSAAMSCPVFSGETTLIEESQCVWGRVTAARAQLFETASADGFKLDSTGLRVGAQWAIGDGWFLGGTAGYGHSNLSTSDGYTSASGTVGDISVALKRQMGPLLLSGSIHAGYGQFDASRLIAMGGGTWRAESTADVWTGAARGRVAYEFVFGDWYLRPYADLDLVYTHVPAYSEKGARASFRVSAMDEWTLLVSPTLEIGGRHDLGESAWLRPYASVGATFSTNDTIGAKVRLKGARRAFETGTDLPDATLNLGAGLQLMARDRYELRGEYKAQLGDHFLGQEAGARFAVRF